LKVFVIGLGRAGCRIAHQFFTSQIENVYGVLIDTDISDLSHLKFRYRIPAGEGIIGGEGTQLDLDLGMEVLQAERFSLVEKITRVKGDVDCFFVFSALGGGTGGAVGILLEELKRNFIEPVYYVGILPSLEDLSIVTLNAAKGLKEAVRHCDAFFPIDMDRVKSSTRLKGNYNSLNNQIFRYFERVFQIGEFGGRGDIGENAVDFSDFEKTVKGLSVVGLKGQDLVKEPNADKPEAVIALTQVAVRETTLQVDLKDVQRALVVVLGDRDYIDFLGSIPARLWVEKSIGGKEVRGGDMPLSRKAGVEVLVVFSGIKRSEEMATLYKKVEVLGKGQLMDESISEVIDRLGAMRMKLVDLEKELGDTYQKLKGSVNKKDGNRKE
jgi:cell division GTPase FtsZ